MENLLLLHGFKRAGEDDFLQITPFLSQFNLYNEEYFDNYDLKTLNKKYLLKRIDEIANKINSDGIEDLTIIGYSAGAIIAPLIKKKLNIKNVLILAIVPPIKVLFSKWLFKPMANIRKSNKIKSKIGKERYEQLKNKKVKQFEKYPLRIMSFINNTRLKYRKFILKEDNIIFLFSKNDEFIKTKSCVKLILKNKQEFSILEFSHSEIMKSQKDIFIKWFEEVINGK